MGSQTLSLDFVEVGTHTSRYKVRRVPEVRSLLMGGGQQGHGHLAQVVEYQVVLEGL